MLQYIICMAVTAVIATLLYMLRLRDYSGSRPASAVVTLFAGAVCGFACSKLMYVLFKLDFSRILSMNPEHFSMFGGAVGVVLAVALCSRLCYVPAGDALNAFAPSGALLLCGARLGEYFLGAAKFGRYGLSGSLEGLMPDEWHICLAEAGFALIGVLLAWFVYDRRVRFLRTAWWVMAWQLLTELMHDQALTLSFVKEEQVACAICIAVIMFIHCRHGISHDDSYRFTPLFWFFAPVVCIAYLEFEMDKCWIDTLIQNIGTDWAYAISDQHELICYIAVLLCVIWTLLLERTALNRRADLSSHKW